MADDDDFEEQAFLTGSQPLNSQSLPGVNANVSQTLKQKGRQRKKVFNDSVHGQMFISDLCCAIIDTPQFQRLRDLKQLGLAYYVFPSAAHNRFEHSIGTCHLASSVVQYLRRDPELRITDEDEQIVSLAGLCHDLGHGPFSHVFDKVCLKRMLPNEPTEHLEHEYRSVAILRDLVKRNDLEDRLTPEMIEDVGALIAASSDEQAYLRATQRPRFRDKRFLVDIVANYRTSVDFDKVDYIQRDSFNCGVKHSVDFQRFIAFMMAVDNDICFKHSEALNIYELFHARASLFQRVYTHKVVKSLEFMVADILSLYNDHCGAVLAALLDGATREFNPWSFLQLDDTILRRIELLPPVGPRDVEAAGPPGSDARRRAQALQDAQVLLHRFRVRDIYKCVGECVVPVLYDDFDAKEGAEITPRGKPRRDSSGAPAGAAAGGAGEEGRGEVQRIGEEELLRRILAEHRPGSHGVAGPLRERDFILHRLSIDWCKKDTDPVSNVFFWQETDDGVEKINIERSQVSSLIPGVFQERRVRLFCKTSAADPLFANHLAAAKAAFVEFERKNFHVKTSIGKTPTKHLGSSGKRPRPPSGDFGPPAKKGLLRGGGAAGGSAAAEVLSLLAEEEEAGGEDGSSMQTAATEGAGTQPTAGS